MNVFFLVLCLLPFVSSWTTPRLVERMPSSSTCLGMAGGFGGSSSKTSNKNNSSNNSKDAIKLKPKQQWDRHVDLKADKFPVAVRKVESPDTEWLTVGTVKSQDNAHTAAAVVRQRALIADVSILFCDVLSCAVICCPVLFHKIRMRRIRWRVMAVDASRRCVA